MKNTLKFFFVLMVLALLLAGCAPKAESPKTDSPTIAPVANTAVIQATTAPAASEATTAPVATKKQKVGVSMPTRANERWIRDGDNIKSRLEALGYEVDLQYAEDDVQAQISQLENMINSGANCLIITPIDPKALLNVLQTAANNKVAVIAYDRLLMDTPNVDYYVTFHNVNVGKTMVAAVAKKLGWDDASNKKIFNVEIFTGSSDDSNAHTAYDGITQGLKPYLDSGKVVIRSGQTKFEQVSILRWSQETAQKRMEDLISGYYSNGEKVDAVFTPSDTLSYGIEAAFDAAGYKIGKDWPLITGQDAEIMTVKNIISGRRFLSMFRDARLESEKVVTMVEAVLKGTKPEINDTTTFNNNVKVVPSYVCDATPITIDNYQSVLIDSGYYKASDIK